MRTFTLELCICRIIQEYHHSLDEKNNSKRNSGLTIASFWRLQVEQAQYVAKAQSSKKTAIIPRQKTNSLSGEQGAKRGELVSENEHQGDSLFGVEKLEYWALFRLSYWLSIEVLRKCLHNLKVKVKYSSSYTPKSDPFHGHRYDMLEKKVGFHSKRATTPPCLGYAIMCRCLTQMVVIWSAT